MSIKSEIEKELQKQAIDTAVSIDKSHRKYLDHLSRNQAQTDRIEQQEREIISLLINSHLILAIREGTNTLGWSIQLPIIIYGGGKNEFTEFLQTSPQNKPFEDELLPPRSEHRGGFPDVSGIKITVYGLNKEATFKIDYNGNVWTHLDHFFPSVTKSQWENNPHAFDNAVVKALTKPIHIEDPGPAAESGIG